MLREALKNVADVNCVFKYFDNEINVKLKTLLLYRIFTYVNKILLSF